MSSVEETQMEEGGVVPNSSHHHHQQQRQQQQQQQQQGLSKRLWWSLIIFNVGLMIIGSGGSVVLRLYFLHGGKRMWLASFIQISGWPLLFLPLSLSYLHRRHHSGGTAQLVLLTPSLSAACAGIGVLMGASSYIYGYSSSYLPLSTSTLLSASQLAFTAVFALLIVRQRFTPYSINSVVVLTLAPVVLSLNAGGDRPAGETTAKYFLGFFMSVAAAAMVGLTLPLMELMYMRTKKAVTYALVMEMQLAMGVAGTAFSLVGMLVNKDFQAIPREAREFDLGEEKYYIILVGGIILWQLSNVGLVGFISCAPSLLAGILTAAFLPLSVLTSAIIFHDMFDGGKGIALVLSLWGFISYLYGEWKQSKQAKTPAEEEATALNP